MAAGSGGGGGLPARAAAPLCLLLCLLVLRAGGAAASEGDFLPEFVGCVDQCADDGCVRVAGAPAACPAAAGPPAGAAPLALRALRWDCEADCRYHCMAAVEGARRAAGGAPVKYFGKWPFTRLAGMQEAASVLLSLANFAAHALGLAAYQEHTRPLRRPGAARALYPHRRLWLLTGGLALNAWLASALFHARDTRVTERLDYLSADLFIFGSAAAAGARTLELGGAARAGLLGAAALFLARHFHYMLAVRFDYGYNVNVCIAAGAAQAVAWVAWCLRRRHPARATLLAYIALLNAAALLEVFDFPPLGGLLDAHACWHAATVPLTFLWWRFLREDVSYHVARAGGFLAAYKDRKRVV